MQKFQTIDLIKWFTAVNYDRSQAGIVITQTTLQQLYVNKQTR